MALLMGLLLIGVGIEFVGEESGRHRIYLGQRNLIAAVRHTRQRILQLGRDLGEIAATLSIGEDSDEVAGRGMIEALPLIIGEKE